MAISFSSTTSIRSLLSVRDSSYNRATGKCIPPLTAKASSLGASSNYVKFLDGSIKFCCKAALVAGESGKKRQGFGSVQQSKKSKLKSLQSNQMLMEKTLETVRENFNGFRTGRASPTMLDRLEVEYYGSPVSLKSIAQITTPDGSSLLIQPYDKSCLKIIEKAIVNSNLDLNPSNDGEVIRLTVPQLTSDRRKELAKLAAKQAEEGKVAIRNIRRDAIKSYEKLEKEKKLSEDIVKDLSGDLQKVTDDYMKKIEALFKLKEKEMLKV
ncbi:hypothetical protein C5167_043463 [Papaver somniferum]|uniref:Ribosome-recycling factor, chloroplastic n=1 Tax=Papaver somniferum TaxID=3469 RepID=A0A4Y7L5T5_PAPSO|nr:hypothetical protein C5167_043463 [Papaver somniferum]